MTVCNQVNLSRSRSLARSTEHGIEIITKLIFFLLFIHNYLSHESSVGYNTVKGILRFTLKTSLHLTLRMHTA